VKRITGKEPMGLREFVEKNKRLFETGNAPKVRGARSRKINPEEN
jgi:hypothetical protein